MMTWTTMVLLILLGTTSPILVLRRLGCLGVVVSAIYFFLFFVPADAFAGFFAAGALLALALGGFAAADFSGFAAAAAGAFAAGAAFLPVRPSSCSRMMVWMRATSLRNPRIFLRLSVCPILSWNFNRKSWSLSSVC